MTPIPPIGQPKAQSSQKLAVVSQSLAKQVALNSSGNNVTILEPGTEVYVAIDRKTGRETIISYQDPDTGERINVRPQIAENGTFEPPMSDDEARQILTETAKKLGIAPKTKGAAAQPAIADASASSSPFQRRSTTQDAMVKIADGSYVSLDIGTPIIVKEANGRSEIVAYYDVNENNDKGGYVSCEEADKDEGSKGAASQPAVADQPAVDTSAQATKYRHPSGTCTIPSPPKYY